MKTKAMLLAAAVMLTLLITLSMTATAEQPKAKVVDPKELLRIGVQLTVPQTAAQLSQAQVREAASKHLSQYMQQASSVTIQRVMYKPQGSQGQQPAWMVILDGLSMPSRGPRGIPESYNTQLILILDDAGQPLISYTYQ